MGCPGFSEELRLQMGALLSDLGPDFCSENEVMEALVVSILAVPGVKTFPWALAVDLPAFHLGSC